MWARTSERARSLSFSFARWGLHLLLLSFWLYGVVNNSVNSTRFYSSVCDFHFSFFSIPSFFFCAFHFYLVFFFFISLFLSLSLCHNILSQCKCCFCSYCCFYCCCCFDFPCIWLWNFHENPYRINWRQNERWTSFKRENMCVYTNRQPSSNNSNHHSRGLTYHARGIWANNII